MAEFSTSLLDNAVSAFYAPDSYSSAVPSVQVQQAASTGFPAGSSGVGLSSIFDALSGVTNNVLGYIQNRDTNKAAIEQAKIIANAATPSLSAVASAQQKAQAEEDKTFWQKYQIPMIAGGAVILLVGIALITRRK